MKYLLSAASILAALCLGLLLAPLLTTTNVAVEGSLVVNQRVYLPQELEERLKATPYHFDNREDLVADLIYRELLLQEAKKEKIDAEPNFLHSMRDFYEQSMIKTLLDRQYQSEKHRPNDAQIAACQPLLSRIYTLKRFDFKDHAAAQANKPNATETYHLPYLDLPEDSRSALLALNGSELSPPIQTGNNWFRLQLIDMAPIANGEQPSAIEQEELCRSELQRQSIQNWVEELHRKSTIEIPKLIKEGNNG